MLIFYSQKKSYCRDIYIDARFNFSDHVSVYESADAANFYGFPKAPFGAFLKPLLKFAASLIAPGVRTGNV